MQTWEKELRAQKRRFTDKTEDKPHRRSEASSYYGPCAHCDKHWTRKRSETEAGICRFCLAVLKGTLER